ncbi:hypothetical protein [Thermoactinospora rubra]|uniref:hypothetical protein n=1 Tax=Thermoactinospora rubra TaxID=1088767 RepID=UPI00117DD0F7|nr:hypothetical protein [Thermoactinospora rubra]
MVSPSHEALHRVFQADTTLVTCALDHLLGVTLPKIHAITRIDSDMTEHKALVRQADSVFLLETDKRPHAVIVESQLKEDHKKPAAWAYYASYMQANYGTDPVLLVICRDLATAKWARQVHRLGLSDAPCLLLHPLVLGPDNVPVLDTLDAACANPSLAVLSSLVHSLGPQASDILGVLAPALATIDVETALDLSHVTEAGLEGTPALQIWRALMSAMTFPYQTELERQGEAKGLAKGRVEGRAEGEAIAVLRVLRRRGIPVPEDARQRIAACTDTAQLEQWLDRALEVDTIDELFA